ncbi:MAG: aminopeptidase N [Caulobacterales bacterium]|jgi:aminopeptidase N
MRDDAVAVRLADYRPADFAIDQITLDFDLHPDATGVKARSLVRRQGAAGAPLVLDGERLELVRLAVDGQDVPADGYLAEPDRLIIHAVPDNFALEIETTINPAGNTHLEGLYMSGGRFCTQCEAQGFRKITYFLDRPDNLARYSVRMEADQASFPTLLSNGDPIERGEAANGRHYAVWRDPHPKPSYLFALVAGAFDHYPDTFTTQSGRVVTLGIYVDPGDGARAAYAMDALKRSMRWDEVVFQREYDLDVFNIVAVRDFNFGAMENKGLNVFNSAYVLADARSATDFDFEAIESIVGHEYFHNWTGNRITCRDWFQLSLKEGLTVFRDQEFSADQRSRPVQRIRDVKRLRARQFGEDAGPLAHPVRPTSYQKIDNFYTATVYEKGAEVIRMLKILIGDEAFDHGMQLYFTRHDGQACTIEHFLACFAEASGQDLSHFARWYGQAGTPVVTASGQYDGVARTYALTVTQATAPTPGQPSKQALTIPLSVGFIDADGARLAVRVAGDLVAREDHKIALTEDSATFLFEGVARAPIPALLRGFSAPVILRDGLGEDQRLAQMAHEPDAFTRWEAGQTMARALILEDGARSAGRRAAADAFADAIGKELQRAQKDPAFAALALRLPDMPELVQTAATPDPEALFASREALRALIGERVADDLLSIATAPLPAPFSPDAGQAGQRALKAAALDLLAAVPARGLGAIEAAFAQAGSMTETMAALEALSAVEGGEAAFDAALEAFYSEWRDQPLVIDKWFSVQASAPRDGGKRAMALRSHPDFTLKNPNRVRALASAFAVRNVRAFHAADGSGYRFLAEIVGALDATNPMVAARLANAFESWRRFDAGRQAHALAALEGLARGPSVSANLAEVANRLLR